MTETQGQLDWASWEAPLRRFADATPLVVSAYDATGARRIGPIASSPLGRALAASSLFAEGGPADAAARRVGDATRRGDGTATALEEGLRLGALEVRRGGERAGFVAYGWVLADFASGLTCERLARAADLDGRKLWSIARLESPVSEPRLATFGALLATIVENGVRLRDAIDELERMGRAREVLLAHVSHDLRTPLAAISTRIELLLGSSLDEPALLRRSLEAMLRRVQEEARLVDDLLETAVTRTGRLELVRAPCQLDAVARDACDSLAAVAEARGVSLEPPAAGEALPLLGDARRLQQAIGNVVSNAVKFTPHGGHVVVRAFALGAEHVVEVEDDGPGISPEMLPRIFEAFARTTKENATGLGLGLAIARDIVHAHGGRVSATSTTEPRATTFTLALPTA